MKVIGLTNELRGAAEQQCAEGFRAWIVEAKQGTWGNWDELKKHFPEVCQTGDDEAHFPLTPHGTGINATVFFKPQLLMLHCISPAPVTSRTPQRRISPHPIQTNTNTHKTISHTP